MKTGFVHNNLQFLKLTSLHRIYNLNAMGMASTAVRQVHFGPAEDLFILCSRSIPCRVPLHPPEHQLLPGRLIGPAHTTRAFVSPLIMPATMLHTA